MKRKAPKRRKTTPCGRGRKCSSFSVTPSRDPKGRFRKKSKR